MKTMGILCWRWVSSRWRSGPDMPGMAMSRTRHLVRVMESEARNSSADEKARATKPRLAHSKSGKGLGGRTGRHRRPKPVDAWSLQPPLLVFSIDRWRRLTVAGGMRARFTGGSARNGEGKCGSRAVVGGCPKTAVVALDNGVADGQADAHAFTFGGIESVEEFVGSVRGSRPTPASPARSRGHGRQHRVCSGFDC